jgi:ElaB/YqjD/DUF883 family membrane-anchored ribosome-binding protein
MTTKEFLFKYIDRVDDSFIKDLNSLIQWVAAQSKPEKKEQDTGGMGEAAKELMNEWLQKKEQDTDKDREKLLSKLKDAKQRLTADFYQNWSHVQIAIDAAIKYIKNQGTGTDTDVEKLAEEAITNFPYKGSLELFAKEAFIAGYNAAKQTK